jgi:hypothetical protein
MISRSATATIKGYYYQFDTTILKILELKNVDDSITVEGIEDIDINTANEITAVQCKYLSKPKLINSVIRDPIMLMLDNFIGSNYQQDLKYNLYTHFEDETPGTEFQLSLEKLKEILAYSQKGISKAYHIDNNVSDQQLESFIKNFKLIYAFEFNKQQNYVMKKLENLFSSSSFEADMLFYNNALRVVIDLAKESNIEDRKITKEKFVRAIDCRKKLFNEWYAKLRSHKEYLKMNTEQIKTTNAFKPTKIKFIIIGRDLLNIQDSEIPLSTMIEDMTNKYYPIGKALRTAKPMTFIIDYNLEKLQKLKEILIQKQFLFNDGYEHIKFNPAIFNMPPIINTTKNLQKINKSSYLTRIISLDMLVANKINIESPDVVINFSKNESPYPNSDNYQLFDIKYCSNLTDINKIIG